MTSSRRTRVGAVLAAALALPGLGLAAPAVPAAAAPFRPCAVDDARLTEASGAVASGHGDVWFAHGDDDAEVVAVDGGCAVLGVSSWGRPATDLEDVDRAVVGGRPFLFFADTGDNTRVRAEVSVVRVPQPTAPWRPVGPPAVFPLRFSDGPHDVETLLVADDGQSAVLVEKTGGAAAVWAADLRTPGTTAVLQQVGRVALPPAMAGQVVTSGRVAPDGRRVALRTYEAVAVWALPSRGSFASRVAQGLASRGTSVAVPAQPQGEALDWDAAGLRLVSEGRPADVVRVPEADLPRPSYPSRRVRWR